MSYCDIAPGHPIHGPYHDLEYGFPVYDDRRLFERLCLEVFQAGLSWEIILKKRAALNAAFYNFDPNRVAAMTTTDVDRLMNDPSIIRYRRKIEVCIENAQSFLKLSAAHNGFAGFLAAQPAMELPQWVKLLKTHFKFMGPEVVNEFLMSISILPGAHRPDCPICAQIQLALDQHSHQ